MSQEIIFQKICTLLKDKMSINTVISEDTALLGDDIMDSMEFLKYLSVIEEDFNLSISDEELENHKLGIVKNMVEFLNLKES